MYLLFCTYLQAATTKITRVICTKKNALVTSGCPSSTPPYICGPDSLIGAATTYNVVAPFVAHALRAMNF